MSTTDRPPRTLTLLLVRHGETHWNAQNRWQGQHDVPLSPRGRCQARQLGQRLKRIWDQEAPALPGPPDAVFASDLTRAFETAATLTTLPIQTLPALRERSFGAWEGLTRAEVEARFGNAPHPEDGEGWPAVWRRMDEALAGIWETVEEEATVLVVGHGGSLRVWLARALGLSQDGVPRFRLDNASLSAISLTGPRLEEATGRLLRLNDTAHLEEPCACVSH